MQVSTWMLLDDPQENKSNEGFMKKYQIIYADRKGGFDESYL